MQYWVVSPNVTGDGGDVERAWKAAILKHNLAIIGWGDDNSLGQTFINRIQRGDLILVAQGANRQKRLFLCGIVSGDAVNTHIPETARSAWNRQLSDTIDAAKLHQLNLNFEDAAYGEANQIPAIYRLKPESNPADKFVTTNLLQAINSKKHMKEIAQYISLLQHKPQIILQGPPGTGKTYTAQEIAYQLLFDQPLSREKEVRNTELAKLEASEQYAFVQFHPAYSYEDFVRGISVKPAGENVVYTIENRLLANFSVLARKNYEESKQSPETVSRRHQVETWVEQFKENIDEQLEKSIDGEQSSEKTIPLTQVAYIYRTTDDGIRYDGENWKIDGGVPFRDIVEMYMADVKNRQQIKELKTLTLSAKGNSTYWYYILDLFKKFLINANIDQAAPAPQTPVPTKPFIIVIDEINRANLPAVLGELIFALEYRNRSVKSLYEHADEGQDIILPSNLYLIGTMNTADRSVGHLDYAIRRRFAFVPELPDKEVVAAQSGLTEAITLFDRVAALFLADTNAASEDWKHGTYLSPDFNPKDVLLGHSYFLANNKEQLRLKLEYEIKPILQEYVRDSILKKEAEPIIKSLSI